MDENNQKSEIRRVRHAGMFQKGISGNPLGRPKTDIKIRDIARQYTEEAIKTLVDVMKNPESKESSKVQAACAILDRAYGKPVQSVENLNIDATQSYKDFLEQLLQEELDNDCIDAEFNYLEPSLDELADEL